MSDAKRRRIDVSSGGIPRSQHGPGPGHRRSLAASCRVTELTAEQLEAELFALHSGLPEHRTLAWSCKNLIAFASPIADPISTSVSHRERQKSDSGGVQDEGAIIRSGHEKKDGPGGGLLAAQGELAGASKLEQQQQHERNTQAQEDTVKEQAEARSRAFQAFLPPPAQSVTLRFVYLPDSQPPESKRRPALTAHKLFPSFSLLPPTSAVSSPTLISFSPSGRTLIAYFPASPLAKKLAAATRAGELAAGNQAHLQAHAQAQNTGQAGPVASSAAPNVPSRSGTGLTPALVSGSTGSSLQSQSVPPLDPSHVATSLAPSAGKGRLCIWTQGASMALNDWALRQIFFVEDDHIDGIHAEDEGTDQERKAGSSGAPAVPPGFVRLDGLAENVPVPIPATPISDADAVLEAASPGMPAIPVLKGGIKEIRWCNQGRNLFIHPDAAPAPVKPDSGEDAASGAGETKAKQPDPVRTSYIRDAARGPTFTTPDPDPKAAPQGSGSATDSDEEACFLFGMTGIVSVVHRKPSLVKTPTLGFAAPTTFSLTSTSLFESSIVPLGTQGGNEALDTEQSSNSGAAAATTRRITHLAVGGVPDEPLLLVACRIGSKLHPNRDSTQIGKNADFRHDQDGSGLASELKSASQSDSRGSMDPLGLMTTVTGLASGATDFTSASIESGLGLGIGLEVSLGFEAGRASGASEAIEDVFTVSEGMILLLELRLRTHGHLPSVVVRPLNPLPMPSIDALASPAVAPGDGILTHIQWLEYPSLAPSAASGTSPLQLLLVSSHAASTASAPASDQMDFMEVDDEAKPAHHSSIQKYVFQRQLDPLSEAFGSLECKKAELPHAKPDWTFVDAGLVIFEGRSLLSLIPAQDLLQHGCLATITKGPRYQTSWTWLDPASLQLVDLDDKSKPLAHLGSHERIGWAHSPSKVWAARTIGTGAERKVQLVTIPSGPKLAALDETTRKGLLLGRALRLGQSYDDLPLSFSKDSSALYDIVQTALVRAGIHNNNVPKKENNQNHRLQQLERVVEIHLLPRSGRTDRMRLFLELLLCLRLLRFNDLGSRIPHLPFRFDSIWPLLAQLSWVLQILNRMSRTAVYLEAESLASGEHEAATDKVLTKGPKFANNDPLLELLVLPAPRAIFVYIVQSLYRLAFWLLGDEAGPIPTNLNEGTDSNSATKGSSKSNQFGVRNRAYTQTVSDAVIAWRKLQVSEGEITPTLENFLGPAVRSTIAQQYELAADACRALLDASAIRLDRALKVLQQQGDNPARASQSRWLEELLAGDLSEDPSYRTLAAGWLHKTDGADPDLVPMFLSPEDLLDDVHALDRVTATAAATSLAQMARQNETRSKKPKHLGNSGKSGIGPDEHDVGLLSTDIVRKTCLQLRVLGFNQATAFGQPPSSSQAVPTVIKLCVRCGARTGTINLPPVLSKGLSVFESAFRERCLCGGSWWFLTA
ncbi:hypothetical protein OC846_000637 [Tilletia horrida]|uniref:Mediator complex subunit 16 n=1 Tax=Tilletia horrida TaxID=155126 RepID=A0AAN6JUJ2_9BASI|nr:hypothetical protein OC846_000637 [Tilletia horrida]